MIWHIKDKVIANISCYKESGVAVKTSRSDQTVVPKGINGLVYGSPWYMY